MVRVSVVVGVEKIPVSAAQMPTTVNDQPIFEATSRPTSHSGCMTPVT